MLKTKKIINETGIEQEYKKQAKELNRNLERQKKKLFGLNPQQIMNMSIPLEDNSKSCCKNMTTALSEYRENYSPNYKSFRKEVADSNFFEKDSFQLGSNIKLIRRRKMIFHLKHQFN